MKEFISISEHFQKYLNTSAYYEWLNLSFTFQEKVQNDLFWYKTEKAIYALYVLLNG